VFVIILVSSFYIINYAAEQFPWKYYDRHMNNNIGLLQLRNSNKQSPILIISCNLSHDIKMKIRLIIDSIYSNLYQQKNI